MGGRTTLTAAEIRWRTADRCGALILVAENNAAFGEIVRGHLNGHAIAGQDTDAVFAHLSSRVGQRLMPVVELHKKPGVGQHLEDGAFEFDQIFFCHLVLPESANASGAKHRGGPNEGRPAITYKRLLFGLEIGGRRLAFAAALKLEAQTLSFAQVADARTFDSGNVDEHVLAAVIGLNKTVTLGGVEPFNSTAGHKVPLG